MLGTISSTIHTKMLLLICIVLSTTSQITLAESSISYTTTSITTNNGLISVPKSEDSSSIIEYEKTNHDNNNNLIEGEEEDITEGGIWETCSSHKSCTECYDASSTCHWCSHDNKCHVKGSPLPLGCITGASCDGSNNSTKAVEHCADHTTCSSCSDSSWGCHWCASDEKCHAKFSMQGCTLSTDCYAINRCQRLEPERMEDPGIFSSASFAGVGPVAKGVLGVLMGLILCCSTLCFGGVTFLKCAVDDLVGEPVEIVEDGVVIRVNDNDGLARQQQQQEYQYERVVDTAEADEGGQLKQDDDDLEMPLMQNEKGIGDDVEQDGEEGSRAGKKIEHEEIEETPAVLLPKRDAHAPILRRAADGAASISRMSRRSMSSNRVTPRGSSIKRMYCGCQLCYLFTVISTIILFIVGMSYAPREPHINVCTNELAWKSIVEGMASLKMSASFDLLISVYNPNKFEVDLSNGHGQFHHDDQYVGSFDIPEGKISENAISDIVVKVTFTPDKWSALSLTSEYYQGKLKFIVGGHAHIKIPGLGNYQFDAKFDDIHVNVNDPSMDDTHLCACPGWKKPVL